VVTTSTTTLAFRWPSALTSQLVASIGHIADDAPQSLGFMVYLLGESTQEQRHLTQFGYCHGSTDCLIVSILGVLPDFI
jgi:hypothetical protein